MNAQQRLLFRQVILAQITRDSENGGRGLPTSTLRIGCKWDGFVVDDDEVEAECEGYLQKEGFITASSDEMNKSLKRYRLTAAGRAYVTAEGLA